MAYLWELQSFLPTWQTAIVIDNGSEICKVGFATDEKPSSCFKTNFSCFNKGKVSDFAQFTNLHQYIHSNILHVSTGQHPVLMTERLDNPKELREQTMSVVLETIGAPGFYITSPPVLSLFASGRTTGLCIDSGHTQTSTVAVYQGRVLPGTISKLDFGGLQIRQHMSKILAKRGLAKSREAASDLKENSYVAFDYEKEERGGADLSSNVTVEKVYELPDGEELSLADDFHKSPEILFKPSLVDKKCLGIDRSLLHSLTQTDSKYHSSLLRNIVLSGGNTLWRGTVERLDKEIKSSLKHSNFTLVAPLDRSLSAWMGGSIMASLSNFKLVWITKAELQEYGPAIVHKRCVI